ncbi:MAG TPA: D-alanine--D-alanine ligase family protein [Vicinamibacterales bacterium]|nr:D-alanine--D-alanine ligase family protein [Vicinamibacterales bacterium]
MKRKRLGVIFGGRSSEHEVSVRSASSVLARLDPSRYDTTAVYIDPNGRWILPSRLPDARTNAEAREFVREQSRSFRRDSEVVLPARPAADDTMLVLSRASAEERADHLATASIRHLHLDVAFPLLHGPHGEDGTIQGLFELANVPYVGAGVTASAVGMDKAVAKALFRAAGIPTPRFLVVSAADWRRDRAAVLERVCERLPGAVFVKPACLGSSVGISPAADSPGLETALDLALQFDRRAVVEAAVPRAREIEVAVLGNDAPEASLPGEILPADGCPFYDYDAKYLRDSGLLVPAPLEPAQTAAVRALAVEAYRAVGCEGLGRVDFLLARESGTWFASEINTMPGFTTISMYPRLWEATGLGYAALLDRLIDLALERHAAKQNLRTSA